jgi:hypothetical protein
METMTPASTFTSTIRSQVVAETEQRQIEALAAVDGRRAFAPRLLEEVYNLEDVTAPVAPAAGPR